MVNDNTIVDDANVYKDAGNDAFKKENWSAAIESYTKAIKLGEKHKDLAIFYKNRAAAYLKLNDHERAEKDCTVSLELAPNDPKALFRRSQALESLERFEEAYRDARGVWNADPNNKAIQPALERLHNIVQERSRKNAQTANKVTQMVQIAFDLTATEEKRKTAVNNLLVLAKEESGAELLSKEGVPHKIAKMVKVEKCNEIILNGIRTVDEICRRSLTRTRAVIETVGIPW